MSLSTESKGQIVGDFRRNTTDTGSPEVQIALLSARISELGSYLRLQLATLPGAEILTPSHPSLSSDIFAVRLPGRDHAAIARSLAEGDGIVMASVGQGAQEAMRISVHASNDHEQIDRCVNALLRHA